MVTEVIWSGDDRVTYPVFMSKKSGRFGFRHPTPICYDASGPSPTRCKPGLVDWAQRYSGTEHEMTEEQRIAYNAGQLGVEGATKFEAEYQAKIAKREHQAKLAKREQHKREKKQIMRKKAKKEVKTVPVELVRKVQGLWKSDKNSAIELGKALMEVKAINPHGGLNLWISKNIGKGTSIRNRCSYCMRLANGKATKNDKSSSNGTSDRELTALIHDVDKCLKQLYYLAKAGNAELAEVTAKGIIEKVNTFMAMARTNEAKVSEKAAAAKA
jgi:hypothetical protein